MANEAYIEDPPEDGVDPRIHEVDPFWSFLLVGVLLAIVFSSLFSFWS